ncbi:amino acid permease [bacterium]|nr:amino acid permease [bacterium]MDC0259243.1 amino acid permease [Verrucomicrobiales bacterium]
MTAPVAKISLFTAITVVVANMVGTGIFGSLGFQVLGLPSGFPILLLWIIGGVLAFCGAVCYAELGSMMPRSGGEYHLLRETYHPLVGFLAGWVSVTIGFAAPIALNASLLGGYMSQITEFDSRLFSVPVVILVTAIHLASLSKISRFQIVLTTAKIVLILVLAAAAFVIGTAQPVSFLPKSGDGELIASSAFATSLVYVLYAYTGWNAAVYIVGEMKDPQRNLPLAMLIGAGFVTVIYVLLNAAFLYATPISEMAGEAEVGLVAARSIFGDRGGMWMGVLISFGLISTISSMTWAGPRATATIGEDYGAFSFFKKRNSNGIPARAVLLQGVIVLVLLLVSDFESLIHYTQAVLTISATMVVLGVIWMRIKKPNATRTYRAWGYPVTPLIFIVFSIYVLFFQIQEKPKEFFLGLGTLAIGAVVYFLVRRGKSSNS